MEGLEIHPVLIRTVCLNQPHLKPWWVTQGLSRTLQCFYNPHQPQVIWTKVPLNLPAPRILRIKGYTTHALPSSEDPSISVNVQMGTYLMFYIPKTNNFWSSCQLVLNGVQNVSSTTENPSAFSVHLVNNDEDLLASTDRVNGNTEKEKNTIANGNSPKKEKDAVESPKTSNQGHHQDGTPDKTTGRTPGPNPKGEATQVLYGDFEAADVVKTIAEEEVAARSDEESDASEDIHELVLRRLAIDLRPLMTTWEKSNQNILVLLVKPQAKKQAWQFISSWITIKEKSRDVSTSSLTRRKGVTRTKPSPQTQPATKTKPNQKPSGPKR